MNLDACARLHLDRRERLSSYFWCGAAGVVVGIAVVAIIAGMRPGVRTVAWFAMVMPLPVFLIGVKVAHILVGYERIVEYEQFLAVLVTVGLTLHLMGHPVWLGVELVTIGFATALAFGRIGCLRVGCCHGRPARWGIRYTEAHARAGFTEYYVGVRLVPIQLVAHVVVLLLSVASTVLFLSSHRPGEVVCFYFATYALARFVVEFWRGDANRPYVFGSSESQWIALATSWAAVIAHRELELEFGILYWATASTLSVAIVALAIADRRSTLQPLQPWRLRHPHRVKQLADALATLGDGASIDTAETCDGLKLSFSHDATHRHYAVSSSVGTLGNSAAQVIAEQLAILTHSLRAATITPGQQAGVFHILFAVDAS